MASSMDAASPRSSESNMIPISERENFLSSIYAPCLTDPISSFAASNSSKASGGASASRRGPCAFWARCAASSRAVVTSVSANVHGGKPFLGDLAVFEVLDHHVAVGNADDRPTLCRAHEFDFI